MDETGRVVRIDDGAYSQIIDFGGGATIGTAEYRPIVLDWVANGEDSPYIWSAEEMAERIRRPTSDEALADPTFKLGVYFHGQDEALARSYWERAQALAPDNWNYHRQDWNMTEGLAGPKYRQKRSGLGDRPYYEPFEIPENATDVAPDAAAGEDRTTDR